MTIDVVVEHYATSIVRQLRIRRMLFVQATANFEDDDGALTEAVLQQLQETTGLPLMVLRPWDAPRSLEHNHAVVLTDLQSVADGQGQYWLATVRPELTEAVERGSLLLILSAIPRIRLTGYIGSLVSMDCAYYRLEEPGERVIAEALRAIPDREREDIISWSQLQTVLLRRLAQVARREASNRQKRAMSAQVLEQMAARSFSQLGPDIASWLEYWLFEYQADTAQRVDVPEDILEALLGAGLARLGALGRDDVLLLPGPARESFTASLRQYLDSVVKPPARLPDLAAALFTLERMIRLAAKRELFGHHGDDWRDHLPASVTRMAISRARSEVPRYDSLASLPNPLEWMSLGELAEVVGECCAEHEQLAGIQARVWRRLFEEVAPIRNRTAHMRLMRYGDFDTVRRWQRELRMRAPSEFDAPEVLHPPNSRCT